MKTIIQGIGVSLQFFTKVPLPVQLPWERRQVQVAFAIFPLIGALIGASHYAVVHYFSAEGHFVVPFLLLLLSLMWTGGLHLDGWLDTCDSFFSYRDREKRLEIMDDPRVGSFAVIGFVTLWLGKFVAYYELQANASLLATTVLLLPVVVRAGVPFLLTSSRCAKPKGLAYFFQQSLTPTVAFVSFFFGALVVLSFGTWPLVAILLIVLISATIWYSWFIHYHYGGITGDLIGAYIEGMEWLCLLVMMLLTYIGIV